MIEKGGRAGAVNAQPGLVSEPVEEAPLTDSSLPSSVTFHGDPYPPYCCPNCESRRVEAVALRARAGMLRAAVNDREPWGVVAHHAVELVEMMRARGMA